MCHSVLAFLLWFLVVILVVGLAPDDMGATDSACTKVFLLMPSGHRTKKKAGFYFVEIYEGELI